MIVGVAMIDVSRETLWLTHWFYIKTCDVMTRFCGPTAVGGAAGVESCGEKG